MSTLKKFILQLLETAAVVAGNGVRWLKAPGIYGRLLAFVGVYFVVRGVTGWSHEAGAITLGAFLLAAAFDAMRGNR